MWSLTLHRALCLCTRAFAHFPRKGALYLDFPSKEMSQLTSGFAFQRGTHCQKVKLLVWFSWVCLLPLLGCFHPVPLVSLGGLFVSRGASEPWKNEEWNTCYVCWHRSRRVILFLVLALLCPSPGHQLPLGVVLSSRVPHMGTEQGEVMKV